MVYCHFIFWLSFLLHVIGPLRINCTLHFQHHLTRYWQHEHYPSYSKPACLSRLKSNNLNHCRLGQGGGGYHRECLLQVQADARQQGSVRLAP